MRFDRSNALLQFAVFFLMVIGLVPVMISAAFMNERNENEDTDVDAFEPAFETSQIDSPLSDPNYASGHEELIWKIGFFNIALNMSLLAALCLLDNRLEPWVAESMCWRLLLCIGAAWLSSVSEFQLISSSSLHRFHPIAIP